MLQHPGKKRHGIDIGWFFCLSTHAKAFFIRAYSLKFGKMKYWARDQQKAGRSGVPRRYYDHSSSCTVSTEQTRGTSGRSLQPGRPGPLAFQ
jgi:hypothetical protein